MEINKIYEGDSLEVLKTLPDNSINCCITSPPYWGLRDYGTATWVGGDENCNHFRDNHVSNSCTTGHSSSQKEGGIADSIYKTVCKKCGAVRQDRQLGLEVTPEEYVSKLVAIFSEVKRCLTDDGTLWLNLGDTYFGGGGGNQYSPENNGFMAKSFKANPEYEKSAGFNYSYRNKKHEDLKPKDMVGIPWMTAFALRYDGWWLRQDLIWHKPNPMPESVTDRCTKSHEYIFLLSKSQKYYFDYEAILEPYTEPMNRWGGDKLVANGESMWDDGTGQSTYRNRNMRPNENGRNKRDVWTVNTKPYNEAHFATFPENLIVDMVKAGCPPKGLILDPFMGSGTTGLVARKLDRNYVGIELNPKYISIAEQRIFNEIGLFL